MKKASQKNNPELIRRKHLDEYYYTCNQLLRDFCEKHGYDYEEAAQSWVANKVGEIVALTDVCYVGMSDIVTDLQENAPAEAFAAWYDYDYTVRLLGLNSCNYDSWLRGCPRFSEAELQLARERKKQADQAEREFEQLIKEYNAKR